MMLEIYKLEVFGFQGGATYELGDNGVNYISSFPNDNGYYIRYDNNETLYITGAFQFLACERSVQPKEKK